MAAKAALTKSLKLTKQGLRSRILLEIKRQKEEDRVRKSSRIKRKLFSNSVFRKARNVMFYISLGGEVDTQEMIKEAQNQGKIVAVPVCKKNRGIHPCLFDAEAGLKKGPYGISEPAIEYPINLEELDIVVVPGVAFDRRGRRLGRGKGYYDRFLKRLPPKTAKFGLAFDFQILPEIPTTTDDVDVKQVIFA